MTTREMRDHTAPFESAAQRLLDQGIRPAVGVVLGSGLGPLVEALEAPRAIPYAEIAGMPEVGVEGHRGQLVFGSLAGVSVACLSGRVHLYEGRKVAEVVRGVQLLAALGVKVTVLTNAAGGIAPRCAPGNLMAITDHLNLTGHNPLVGPGLTADERFIDMSEAYDQAMTAWLLETAAARNISLVTGVYAGMLGPTYETPAEVTMLERAGADAVGMSTVLEAIALRQRGVPTVGISCISNWAAGKSVQPLSHEDVKHTAAAISGAMSQLIEGFCERLAAHTR